MSTKKIQLNINGEQLKKKLNIKDGKDGKDGAKGDKGDTVVVEKVVEKTEIIKEVPNEVTGEEVVTKINDLPTDNEELKIDAKHIKNLPKQGNTYGGARHFSQLLDVSVAGATNGQVPKFNSTTKLWEAGNDTGSTAFLTLTDTPSSYTGQAGKYAVVNGTEDALEFATIDLSGYVPFMGDSSDLNIGTYTYIGHAIKGDASDGIYIRANNDTNIGLLGAGNTANVTWYGNHNFNGVTASTLASFGASKTLQSASTNSTLTFSSNTLGVNLANANTWTATQSWLKNSDDIESFTSYPSTAARTDSYAVGFKFTLVDNITVNRLGRLYVAGNTLDHAIRLYISTDTTTPIASGTILASSTSDANNFKWISITPVNLTAGNTYIIAVDENTDAWKDQWAPSLQTAFGTPTSVYGTNGTYPVGVGSAGYMFSTPALSYYYNNDVSIGEDKIKTTYIVPSSDNTNALNITKADGTTPQLRFDTVNTRAFFGQESNSTGVYQAGTSSAWILNTRLLLQDQNLTTGDKTPTVIENRTDPFNAGRTALWIYPQTSNGNGQRLFLGHPTSGNQKWTVNMAGVVTFESFPNFILPQFYDSSGYAAFTLFVGYGQSMVIRHNPAAGSYIYPAYFNDDFATFGYFHFKAQQTDSATTPQSYVFDRNATITKGNLASFRNNGTEKLKINYAGALNNDGSNDWIFKGQTGSASVSLDTSQYITVNIGGTDYKLAIVT